MFMIFIFRLSVSAQERRSDLGSRLAGQKNRIHRSVLGTRHEPAQLDYFLCGPPGLIHDTLAALAALGVPEHRVHTEQFDMA